MIRSDGSGLRRLTEGGRENNWLGDWTDDGRFLTMASNRRRAATMDAYLLDPASGAMDMVAELEGVGGIQGVSRDGQRAIVGRLRSRGDNNLYLLDLRTRKEALLTPHEPPGQFAGEISPDGATVYLSSNKDRDLAAFARVRIGPDGAPGPIEVIAERTDAELDGFELSHAGDEATLVWNVAGRNEISFIDLRSGKTRPGPALPAELLGGVDLLARRSAPRHHGFRFGGAGGRLGAASGHGRVPPAHRQLPRGRRPVPARPARAGSISPRTTAWS